MPLACYKSISASSNIIIGLGKLSSRRQRHVSSSCRRVAPQPHNIVTNASDGQVVVITTEKEKEVSPLIRFQSAAIRYPPSSILDDKNIDRDLLLEIESQPATNQRNLPLHHHLPQNYWNNAHINDSLQNNVSSHPFNLNIWPNLECNSGGGGHVVLGRNASGKTLLSRSIVRSLKSIPKDNVDDNTYHYHHQSDTFNNPFLHCGKISIHTRNSSNKNRNHHFLSHVSFSSHSDLLHDKNTTTVHRALIPSGGNRLSPTAQFLSVRLGMFPLLHRRVDTLSTGEIRRVLLVRALVSKPELLVLDNAFDGLDVRGRQGLQDIVQRVLNGFRMDILVQGVNAKDAARTQVLLLTHRPEEIVDGIGRVTFIDERLENGIKTEDRRGRNGEELVESLMSSSEEGVSGSDYLPSNADIQSFWEHNRSKRDVTKSALHNDILFHSQNLKVTRDDTTILSHLNWTVKRGERWHLAGTNGAGKSTIGRLILRASMTNNLECDSDASKSDAIVSNGSLSVIPSMSSSSHLIRGGVSWVSTELHLHATHHWGNRSVREILRQGASFLFNTDGNPESRETHSSIECYFNKSMDMDIATMTVRWLGILRNQQVDNDINDPLFLARPFSSLSQGEQKLILLASAIAQRPSLLILDEPCQGLDLWNRACLLNLIEKICNVTDMSLLYVTHHEEELIPSISHRLCLEDGKVTYCGLIDKW